MNDRAVTRFDGAYLEYLSCRTDLLAEIFGPNHPTTQESRLDFVQTATIVQERQKGFTLIELMIVVVIIGILAMIAIPNYIAMQDNARTASVKANMHNLQLAGESYAVEHDGIYTGSASEVMTSDSAPRFANPFTHTEGQGGAWVGLPHRGDEPQGKGLVSYAGDWDGFWIHGANHKGTLALVLKSGDVVMDQAPEQPLPNDGGPVQ